MLTDIDENEINTRKNIWILKYEKGYYIKV